MGRKRKEYGIKYGCPIYGIAWPPGEHVYMCGGGGHGIENKVTVLSCAGGVQSEEVAKLNTGKDAGYRLVMHPSGRALVCGMSIGGLQRVDLQPSAGSGEPPKLSLSQGEFAEATKGIGPVKGMSFSSDGRFLALGGEDGSIEVLEWPSMKRALRWQASEKAIRNLDYSSAHSDGVLISCDEGGACKLWAADSGEQIAALEAPPDMPRATFFRCKSAVDEEGGGILLYTPLKWRREGWLAKWRQDEDGSIRLVARTRKPVAPSPICGFELSRSGELLAAVTPDGDQVVLDAASLATLKYVKGAHMTFATSVAFSPDEQYVISGSSDASAVLTRIGPAPGAGAGGALGIAALLLALLLALAALAVGLLLHYAQAAPEEARALVAAAGLGARLPPPLAAMFLGAPMPPPEPPLRILVQCQASDCLSELEIAIPEDVRAARPASITVDCMSCARRLRVALPPEAYDQPPLQWQAQQQQLLLQQQHRQLEQQRAAQQAAAQQEALLQYRRSLAAAANAATDGTALGGDAGGAVAGAAASLSPAPSLSDELWVQQLLRQQGQQGQAPTQLMQQGGAAPLPPALAAQLHYGAGAAGVDGLLLQQVNPALMHSQPGYQPLMHPQQQHHHQMQQYGAQQRLQQQQSMQQPAATSQPPPSPDPFMAQLAAIDFSHCGNGNVGAAAAVAARGPPAAAPAGQPIRPSQASQGAAGATPHTIIEVRARPRDTPPAAGASQGAGGSAGAAAAPPAPARAPSKQARASSKQGGDAPAASTRSGSSSRGAAAAPPPRARAAGKSRSKGAAAAAAKSAGGDGGGGAATPRRRHTADTGDAAAADAAADAAAPAGKGAGSANPRKSTAYQKFFAEEYPRQQEAHAGQPRKVAMAATVAAWHATHPTSRRRRTSGVALNGAASGAAAGGASAGHSGAAGGELAGGASMDIAAGEGAEGQTAAAAAAAAAGDAAAAAAPPASKPSLTRRPSLADALVAFERQEAAGRPGGRS